MKTRSKFNNGLFTSFVPMLLSVLALVGCSANPTPTNSLQGQSQTPLAVPANTIVPSAQPTLQENIPAPTAPVSSTLVYQPETNQPVPMPLCAPPAVLTPSATEGPYFTANSPERASLLEEGMDGVRLTLSGYVLTADCQPVANALLDFWQADANGHYDNSGYTLRGHQFSDANGRYQLETVVPGLYPGRTEHIHVKVQAPGGQILTTQLFFPEVLDNQSDQIFDPALLIAIEQSGESLLGAFNFILNP